MNLADSQNEIVSLKEKIASLESRTKELEEIHAREIEVAKCEMQKSSNEFESRREDSKKEMDKLRDELRAKAVRAFLRREIRLHSTQALLKTQRFAGFPSSFVRQ